jgi:hypothetical protein
MASKLEIPSNVLKRGDERNHLPICLKLTWLMNATVMYSFSSLRHHVLLASPENGRRRITAPPARFARLLKSFPQFILLVKVCIYLGIQLLVWPDEVKSR